MSKIQTLRGLSEVNKGNKGEIPPIYLIKKSQTSDLLAN